MANTKVIVIPEGKICDYIDGKFRNDTPEEYVRQTIEKRLVNSPVPLLENFEIQHGQRSYLCDVRRVRMSERKARIDAIDIANFKKCKTYME